MTAIRRQAFLPPSTEAPQSDSLKQVVTENTSQPDTIAKNRQAFSLAAAAAESKGVELQSQDLEKVAEAIDPEWQERQDSSGQDSRQRKKNQQEQKDDGEPVKSGSINALNLEKIALENAEKNPLLFLLNRLPGKNSQRWIVLPFDFCENGRDLRISMRILLETDHANKYAVSNRSAFMALDIFEAGNVKEHMSFVLEAADNKVNRLFVFIQPEFQPKVHSSFKSELSKLLEIPPERIFVKNTLDSFPFESDCGDELFRSIDKAV
jgi:hypothetical protein